MLRSWRELRDARRKGRRDGRAGVPALEDDSLPFDLREMLARVEERVHRLVQRWRQQDQALEVELRDLDQRAVAANARLDDAEMQRDAALAEHERRTADEDERLTRLQEQLEALPTSGAHGLVLDELELQAPVPPVVPISGGAPAPAATYDPEPVADAKTSPDALEATSLGDSSWRGIGPFVYWPLIALIVMGEIPLNAFAFRLFHESDLLTYAMTVTVAVGLVAIAHFLGLLAAREERTSVEQVLLAVFLVVPVAAIAVVSLVRYGYLTDVGGDSAVGPALGTLAFGCINLLVFTAAAGLSYLHHDPRTLLNRRAAVRTSERERERTEGRLADRRRARARREQDLQDEASKRGQELQRRALALEQERRRRQLELESERCRAELDARKEEVLARREQIREAMRPIREAARERAERIDVLNRLVDDARSELGLVEQRVAAIGAERRALWESTNVSVRAAKAACDRLAFTYSAANVRARADRATPRCLEQIPSLEVPAAFENAMQEATSG